MSTSTMHGVTTEGDLDCYAVLGVPPAASDREIRAAYLQRARAHHPDRQAGADVATRRRSEARMQQVNRAWAVLGDPGRRAAYDAALAATAPPAPPRWRPDGGANPAFVPYDDGSDGSADDDADDADEFADGPGRPMPRLLQVLPAALAAVVGPMFEEFLFRGVIYGNLRRALPVGPAMAVSAFIFALVHGDFMAILPLAGLGAMFAALYEKTGSLWPSMVCHALWNGATVWMLWLLF